MHYYQHHIGDFIKATSRLTDSQAMAYLRLIWMYYDSEKPLPNDIEVLALQIGLPIDDVHLLLRAYFRLEDGVWKHSRCDAEIEEYRSFVDKKSLAGKASAEQRKNKRLTTAEQVLNECSTDVQLTNNHKPITNNQIKPSICPPNGELEPAPIKKLPECNHKAVIELYHENLPTMRRVEVWNETRAGYLRQRWREVATELAQEKAIEVGDVLNWWAEFFQSVGKSRFLTGRVNSKDGRAFVADLEWILKPNNFAKIVEGKYHGNN
jgi:uncharacterized protein YdaU (DUF1376 family)